jgi:predicted TIM-barrel fold metal-dependent hydrolase
MANDTPDIFDRIRVIDVDTHITEPADVWTSRVPKKWQDRVPHVVRQGGKDLWMLDGQFVGSPGIFTYAGFDGTIPESRDTFEDCPKASWDAKARLQHMDDEGIYAQVLYPNVGGFGSGRFLSLKDPELMLACVRAYNDFLSEWTSEDPNRLLAVATTPFWDVDETVKEIERCAALGHRAVNFPNTPAAHGQPAIADKHWDPVWRAADEVGLPISFHIGGGDMSDLFQDRSNIGTKANFARVSSLIFSENAGSVADLIFGGVCSRFPNLRFVSVESGVGWLTSMLEAFDWQWSNSGITKEHPEYDLLPSEYFRRQIYGCFWFESDGVRNAAERFPDNILYETDFPHPTCMAPGPQTVAEHPRSYVQREFGDLPEATLNKIFHDNAALVYGLD